MAINNEIMAKAKEAKSVEELMALAKENGMEMTEESANTYWGQLHPASGELSDEELDNVAGGGCYASDGYLMTTIGYKCKYFEKGAAGINGTCCACKYWDQRDRNGYEELGRPVRCLNPNNRKG